MQKWEYLTWGTEDTFGYSGARIYHVNGEDVDDHRSIYEALAEAGENGWELVDTIKTEYRLALVFKRPKVEG